MTKLADYLDLLERLLKQENDILIKYDKSKKIIKVQYYAPTTVKLEGSKNE